LWQGTTATGKKRIRKRMKNPLDYIADKRLRIKIWLVSGVLFSIGATLLTYYAMGVINEQNAFPVFVEVIKTQDWLMNILGMETWLMLRMGVYGIAFLAIKYFPTKLYERNQLFRYGTNILVVLLVIGFAVNFINDFSVLLNYLL
jgi:hypothetical protein